MKRKVYAELLAWKQGKSRETALLIEGARRTGKSYIVEEFARNEYASYILIDFSKAGEQVRSLFKDYLDDLDTFFMLLQAYTRTTLHPRASLIIFDEVQRFPKAREAIKFLVADGRYDYIETGSLISLNRHVRGIQIPSEEHTVPMHPMDFEEFLWAMGDDATMPAIRHCFERQLPMGQAVHRRVMLLFRQYLMVGGMPQAVEKFVGTRDFAQVDAVKRDILDLYRRDIKKYARGTEYKVTGIFNEIPSQLQRHEKRFRFADIDSKARFREYQSSFIWLDEARIVNLCAGVTEPTVGLKMREDRAAFKCYMADTGLLVSHAFDERTVGMESLYQKLLTGKLEVNKGMLVENIVAQMLVAGGHRLYFYSNSSAPVAADRMEIDFLIQKSRLTARHNISPLEVKSATGYTLSSLNKFSRKFAAQLSTPYVLHTGDLKVEDGIVYLPLYMVPLL